VDSGAPEALKPSQDGEVRQRILAEASAVFAESGYEGARVQEIAKRVGISAPALYWHFKSKSDIFATVLEDDYRAFRQRIQDSVTSDVPATRLYQVVFSHVLSQIDGRDPSSPAATTFTISQLIRLLPGERQTEIRRQQREYLELVEQILVDGASDGTFEIDDVRVTAFALVNLAEYVITWYRPDGQLSMDEVAHMHGLLALRMVRTHLPEPDEQGYPFTTPQR
jgi:AcrR family transcriptional regulator